jgi:site-specific DNA recombinase
MATPAAHTPITQGMGLAGPGEPVPAAFLGRTSTLELQDPVASLRRQIRSCQAVLPAGWFIAAWYWDVESGGLDLEDRSQGEAYRRFAAAGIPRDGGMADLLAEAACPVPRFAAVICEDIERSGRDTFNALKLEKKLSRQGIPVFATDEPIVIDGANATTVLVRRVKQGVAECFRLQLKEKTWKGLAEHALDGWNNGPAPYGYQADRVPHPVPVKASQGRTKTRLALDPVRAPVVEQIFAWRVVHKLGMPTIAAKLNADPGRYPPIRPGKGWTAQTVYAILGNPKYTGHMVYGRVRTRQGRRVAVPQDQWLWTPSPVHPVIVDREAWQAAQQIGAVHATSRDLPRLAPAAAGEVHPYRGRVRCRDCQRRMGRAAYGRPGKTPLAYYQCPHTPANPRHAAAHPDHPRTVKAPETRLDQIAGLFFAEHVFGPRRGDLLAAQLPASDADARADQDAQAAGLQARLRQIDTGLNSCILELEQLPADPADPAASAMRARIRARFAELHHEQHDKQAQLSALAAETPKAADTTLLDELPLAEDVLTGLPPAVKARLFAAFDLQILWNKPGRQATVHAEITDATLRALPALLNPGQDGYDDTAEPPSGETADGEDLFEATIVARNYRESRNYRANGMHGLMGSEGGG